jgi:thioredoxin-related protein
MKKTMLLLAAIGMITVSFGQVKFEKTGFEKAKSKAKNENKLIFVDVYADWCGPCKMLDKNVFSDKVVGNILNTKFVPVKIDGDKDDNVLTMMEFDIEAFPTLILIDPKTDRTKKLVGYIDKEDLLEEIDFFMHPEKHPVSKYKASIKGEYTRENHREIIQLMADDRSENGEELELAVEAYISKFPDLDLKNEMDLLIFKVHFHEWENPLVQYMVANPSEFDTEYRSTKFIGMLQHYLTAALEKSDESIIMNQLEIMYPFFKDALTDISKEDLSDQIRTIYRDNK